jgi:hypothetical protein
MIPYGQVLANDLAPKGINFDKQAKELERVRSLEKVK